MHAHRNDAEHLNHAHDIAQRPEHRQHIAQAHPDIGIGIVLFAELFQLVALTSECADDAHAGDVLLNRAGKHALRFVRLRVSLRDSGIKHQRIPDDDRNERKRKQGYLHVHREHGNHIHENQERRAEQFNHLLGDKRAHDLHVGCAHTAHRAGI